MPAYLYILLDFCMEGSLATLPYPSGKLPCGKNTLRENFVYVYVYGISTLRENSVYDNGKTPLTLKLSRVTNQETAGFRSPLRHPEREELQSGFH
jgi:hypothetical protein